MKKMFDCVAFLNDAAENTRLRLAGLSIQEQAAYWRGRNKEVLAEQKRRVAEMTDADIFDFTARLETLRKKRKAFDCVEMKNQAQERIRRELEGKSPEARAAYLREGGRVSPKRQAQPRKEKHPAQG